MAAVRFTRNNSISPRSVSLAYAHPQKMKIKRIPQGLTPIQPFPVEGKGSDPLLPSTGGYRRDVASPLHFQRRSQGSSCKTRLTALGWCVYSASRSSSPEISREFYVYG